MRVGIDGIILRGRDAGSLRYFEQLLTGLAEAGKSNEYIIFADERILTSSVVPQNVNFLLKNTNKNSLLPGAMQQQLYSAWHLFGDLDILHTPIFIPPLWYSGKTVMTIFDLTYLRFPKTQKWTGRFWWRLLGPAGIKKSNHLVAISESTKKDLLSAYKIPEEQVTVIYPYTPAQFKPVPKNNTIINKYHLPESYILYVGTLERRKNITTLLRAFSIVKRDTSLEHYLVLVGQRGWLYNDIFQTVEELGIKHDVIFLGYVPDEDLPGIYSGADMFVFLSIYEGFGFPVLEAMACGVPILTANTSSLPEVVDDAGVLVPPYDIDLAAFEMTRILSDPETQKDLSDRGLAQAKNFSQERFTKENLAVYDKVISSEL